MTDQWVEKLAANPDDPWSTPGTWVGENTFLQVVLGFQYSFRGMDIYPPTQRQDKNNWKKLLLKSLDP